MADEHKTDMPSEETEPDEVAIDYIKANTFSVVWADGAICNTTAQGLIHLALYSERPAIPRRQVFKLNGESGELGDLVPEKTISRTSYVRELSVDVLMDPGSAMSIGTWLVAQAKKIIGEEK